MQERRHQASPVNKNRQQRLSSAGMTGDLLLTQIRNDNVRIGLVPAQGQEGGRRRRPLPVQRSVQ